MAHATYATGILNYPNKFTDDELIVIINNGDPITVPKVGDGVYGKLNNPPDDDFPIRIAFENGINEIAVWNMGVGECNVKIQSVTPSKIETTKCFKKAVRSISGTILTLAPGENGNAVKGATWQEAYDMLVNGAMVYLNDEGDLYPCSLYSDQVIAFSKTVITNVVYTDTYIWNPDGTVIYDSATYPSE